MQPIRRAEGSPSGGPALAPLVRIRLTSGERP